MRRNEDLRKAHWMRGRGRLLSCDWFERNSAVMDSKPNRNGGLVYLPALPAIKSGSEQQAVWCTSLMCMGYGGFQKTH